MERRGGGGGGQKGPLLYGWLRERAMMSQILRCNWLPERATRAGKMLSCPLGITRCPFAWHRKFNPNNTECNLFFDFLVVLGEIAH